MFSDTTREHLKPGVTEAVRNLLTEAITLARTFGEPDLVEEQYRNIMEEKHINNDIDPLSVSFSPEAYELEKFRENRKYIVPSEVGTQTDRDVNSETGLNLVTGKPLSNKVVLKKTTCKTPIKGTKKNIKSKNPRSFYRGVGWDSNAKKWRSRIRIRSKSYELGYFKNDTDAAKAYDKIKYKYTKDVSVLNFPEDYS